MSVKFAVIGVGPWGTKVSTAIKTLGFECCELSGRSGVSGSEYNRVVQWSDIVFIATHPVCCVEMARHALSNGKLTIVEKPVGFDAHEVKDLVDLSRANKVPFIVDYVHLFSPSLMRLKQDDLIHLKITMGGSGPERDYSALWDYGSHAVAIALELAGSPTEGLSIEDPSPGRYIVTLNCHQCGVKIDISNARVKKTVRVEACRSPAFSSPTPYFYEPTGNPLAALISTAARFHLRGEYFTNGALAVEVTDVLERLHAMLPK